MENSAIISVALIVTSVLNVIVIALLACLLVLAGRALRKYLGDEKQK